MPVDAEKLDAYRKAEYVAHLEPDLVFHVGEPNGDLDLLLTGHGAQTAAFVTAANPLGRKRSEAENQPANARLHAAQSAAGYVCYPGEGRDPEGRWPAERSYLIVGIGRDEAMRVGKVFEQNAIVFIEKGRAPELVLLA